MNEHYDPENAASIGSNDGNGNSFNNRAEAPNPFIQMDEEFANAVNPTASNYTSDAGICNPVSSNTDEMTVPEYSAPIEPSALPDEVVGQTGTNDDSKAPDSPSGASDSAPTPKKRGRPAGWRKALPTAPSDEAEHPSVPKPSDSIQSFGLTGIGIGHVGMGSNNLDLFAPENLRVSQDFIEEAGVEQISAVIPVRKPNKKEFVRVRPGEDWQLSVAIIEDSDKEIWIVKPDIAAGVFDEVSCVMLRLAVNRHNYPFLWPLKLPKDGKRNLWNDTALAAAEHATRRWVRVKSDMLGGQYTIHAAKADFGEPKWLDLSFQEILGNAFKDRIITDHNHPILRQLRGEV